MQLTPEQVEGLSYEQKKQLTDLGIKLPLNKNMKPRFNHKLIRQLTCAECGTMEENWFLVDRTCPNLIELKPVKPQTFGRESAKIEQSSRKTCVKCKDFISPMKEAELKGRLEKAYELLNHLQAYIHQRDVPSLY